jgi:hypothetical protein
MQNKKGKNNKSDKKKQVHKKKLNANPDNKFRKAG